MLERIGEVGSMEAGELRGLIADLEHRNDQLLEAVREGGADGPVQESAAFGRIGLAIDNIGWNPLGSPGGEHPLTLDTIQRISETGQALTIVNPMVKRGLQMRTSYVWGPGVQLYPADAPWVNPSVQRAFGTIQAQGELERTGAADGQLFFLVNRTRGTVRRVPITQIAGAALAPGDPERILYLRRTYTDYSVELDVRFGDSPVDGSGRVVEVWYPTDELEGTPTGDIRGIRVAQDEVMVHVPFNRAVGWTWGVPDVLSVIFWSQAYKEFLENSATLTKAYARFAWKVVSSTKKGHTRTASRLAEPPRRDPATGHEADVGAAVALGANQDVQALQSARSVDFNSGRPLAALVAAGLEVPLTALTSDPTEGNRATAETLDEPTKLGMQARQQLMGHAIGRVKRALGVPVEEIEWPEISPEPLHRIVQGVDTAGRTGMLFPKEWRHLLLQALDIGDGAEEPPGESELPVVVRSEAIPPPQSDPPSARNPELRDEPGQQPSARDMM